MEENRIRISNYWLQQLSKGVGSPLDVLTSQSLKVVQAEKGLIRCRFIVSDRLSDGDGNWHVGAMTTLIDNIAGATVHSFSSQIRPTLNFSISYYSTAKIQEEVEIEARVVAEKGKLTSVVIEIKNENGQLIALAKQWTASNSNAGRESELWTALNTTNNNTTIPKSKL